MANSQNHQVVILFEKTNAIQKLHMKIIIGWMKL